MPYIMSIFLPYLSKERHLVDDVFYRAFYTDYLYSAASFLNRGRDFSMVSVFMQYAARK